MIGSFIMTVQTTTLKLNRKMETRNMGKARASSQPRLSKWDFSQMATESSSIFSFSGNQNEQKSLKPLETKILQQFGCEKFIYCSDAGLASEDNRVLNHMGQRAFIVTQSIKKLPAEDRAWALNKTDFKRLSDDKVVDITNLTENDKEQLFYKDEPLQPKSYIND